MYKPRFTKRVIKQFSKIPAQLYEQVFKGIMMLAFNPSSEALDIKKLKDQDGYYRLRVGDYRVIYTIDHEKKELKIKNISHRKEAY